MEEFLTVQEVAEQLGRSEGTIRRWIHTGQLEAQKLPSTGKLHHYRVRKSSVLAIKQRERHQYDMIAAILDQERAF